MLWLDGSDLRPQLLTHDTRLANSSSRAHIYSLTLQTENEEVAIATMPYSLPSFNPARIRTYILRLPLCTRIILILILLFWVCSISASFQQWARLDPKQVFNGGGKKVYFPGTCKALTIHSAHRLTTYAFLHLGILHLLFNALSLTPLLSEFESSHGSINTLILFSGPFTTIPALFYVLIESFIFRGSTSIQGASGWIFLLLSARIVHTAQATPHITLITWRIPTLTAPIFFIALTALLVPHTSLLGHLLGVALGYAWGFGYLKFLVPPERITRWIEEKMNLLGRVPWYVSVDQKTFGRYGILDGNGNGNGGAGGAGGAEMGPGRRLGP